MTTHTQITKREAVAVFGSQAALAKALGITRSAISQWQDDAPIPVVHALRLRYEIAPTAFDRTA